MLVNLFVVCLFVLLFVGFVRVVLSCVVVVLGSCCVASFCFGLVSLVLCCLVVCCCVVV